MVLVTCVEVNTIKKAREIVERLQKEGRPAWYIEWYLPDGICYTVVYRTRLLKSERR